MGPVLLNIDVIHKMSVVEMVGHTMGMMIDHSSRYHGQPSNAAASMFSVGTRLMALWYNSMFTPNPVHTV
jgi:hypothetical protein